MNILFQLIIQPLVLIIETIYMFIIWIIKDKPGIAIIGVSIAVSFLCLPLYLKAEKIQERERAIQEKMRTRVTSIKKHFRGDERYMILSTYYRQNGYHPVFALRSSLGLLFQVPFFIAAYTFLSHLEALQGASFLIIADLGRPDALITIGGLTLNLLPILMTAINLVSSSIYAKNLSLNEKIQLYAMALVFLLLLYTSPAALVLYWTCNNLFSLAKNIVMKIRNPLKFLYILLCIFLLVFCIYVIFIRRHGQSYRLRNYILTLSVSAFLAAIPLYIMAIKAIKRKWFSSLSAHYTNYRTVFILSALALALMIGVYIPFTVVSSSPFEFSFLGKTNSPFAILSFPALQAFGLLFLWPLCLFYLFNNKVKRIFALAFPILLIAAISFGFIFPMSHGIITPALKFVEGTAFKIQGTKESLSFITAAVLISLCIIFISRARFKFITTSLVVLVFSFIGLSSYKATQIDAGYREYRTILQNENTSSGDVHGKIKPRIHLSPTGQNVCVFMLDKAISSYLPLVFQEHPELSSFFDGFTYFPNCLSYSQKTILGGPPLYGGYEYTPVNMNRRSEERMVDKHNESLLLMPTLFRDAGYETLVTDPPFVNYQWVADSEFFRTRNIEAINLIGSLSERYMAENLSEEKSYGLDILLKRNFLVFSILTVAPHRLHAAIYNEGRYWNSTLLSLNTLTLDSYAVLHYLNELTDFSAEKNSFVLMTNNLTHDPGLLEYPDYTFAVGASDPGTNILGESDDYDKYHSNAAALIMLGRWLNYLKEQNVYDNTRIIIVADHGDSIDHPGLDSFQRGTMATYNPLLLYKDFASHGTLHTDDTFMTNADTPFLATHGLIAPLKNPFTKNEISMQGKEDGVIIPLQVTLHQGFTIGLLTMKTCYNPGASAFHVTQSIMDESKWKKIILE